jgi:hypothetical protein
LFIFSGLIMQSMQRQRPAFRLVRRQSLGVSLGLLVLLPAGCVPKPKVPDALQEKLNESAFVQAKVDLLIAKADLDAIENDQYRLDSAHKGWEQANKAKDSADADRLFKEMDEFGKDMDKDIDRAARHRCDR